MERVRSWRYGASAPALAAETAQVTALETQAAAVDRKAHGKD